MREGVSRSLVAMVAVAGCKINFEAQELGDDAAIDRPSPVTFGERASSLHHGVTTDTISDVAKPTWNYGGASVLGTYAAAPWRNYGLVRFELGALAPGATVVAARLELVTVDLDDTEPGSIEVRELAESWVEGTVDAQAGAGATWYDRDAGAPWQMPGGTVKPALVGELTPGPGHGHIEIAIAPSVVQGWLEAPETNHGLRLESPGTQTHYHFASSEAEPPDVRPQLVIDLAP